MSHPAGGYPKFAGSVLPPPSSDDPPSHTAANCNGYIVSMCDKDTSDALVVLEVNGGEMISCLCPTSAMDHNTVEAGKAFAIQQAKKRQAHSCQDAEFLTIDAIPATLRDVHGHLVVVGTKGLRGRVVDTQMLASLQGGCLREKQNPSSSCNSNHASAYFTLESLFIMQPSRLKSVARQIVVSSESLALFVGSQL